MIDAVSPIFAQLAGAETFEAGLAILDGAADVAVTLSVADAFLGVSGEQDAQLGEALREKIAGLRGGQNLIERGHTLAATHALFRARLTNDAWGQVRERLLRFEELRAAGVPNPEAVARVEQKMGFKLNLGFAAIAARAKELKKLFTIAELPIPDKYYDLHPNQQEALKLIGKAMKLLEVPQRLQYSPDADVFERLVMETPVLKPLRPYYIRFAGVFDFARGKLVRKKDHNYYGFLPGMEKVTRPPGGGMYPAGMTLGEFRKFVPEGSPLDQEQRVIFRFDESGQLVAVPYSQAFAEWLEPAAKLLEEAANLLEENLPEMANYLRVTANAYRTNNFIAVDEAWVRLKAETLDLDLAPVEQNADGLRTTLSQFGGMLQIRNRQTDKELDPLKEAFPLLEARLPVAEQYRLPEAERKAPTISSVLNIFATGECTNGIYPARAYNQPNNEAVRRDVGIRVVLMENVGDARDDTNLQTLELADLAIDFRFRSLVTARGGEWFVRFHELAHGHGAQYLIRDSKITSRTALGDIYGSLEELKADMTGIHDAKEAVALGLISEEILHEIYVSYLAMALTKLRRGWTEDHARGNLVALNFLQARGAITIDPETGVINFDFDKYGQAVSELSGMLITF